MSGYAPKRGDAVWLDFNPQAGREQAGRRPALVVSPEAYNIKVGLALVCPITSRAKGYPFEASIPAGLPIRGVVLSDHVKSLDWTKRNAAFICEVPHSLTQEVLKKIEALIR